ncbi:kinase-like protein [Gonapodya prolifera JEL478]|uniref:Kinase-like protein n=1 Tax=Gonapodya prolifera (strain JEL478) TaxID=1344416 RepID=A0A139ARI7_GONPJ|nr:kinase-like protein [Gonapodya prolifera JEL478]|eukprot:KXS19274.1 kinase-like protein [Gonapodya prolifera JEL478]
MESSAKFGNWTVGARIGHGSFSTVSECSHESGVRGVVKTTPRAQQKENGRLPLFMIREVAAQIHVDSHPNVPKVYDYIETADAYHLVMERCEGEELFEFLKKQPGSRLPEDKVRLIMQQLLSALDFMHRRCVLHRDIKLDNLIIDPVTYHLMVIDFNLSTFFLPTIPLTEPVGCIHYANPGLLLAADGHPYRADRGAPDVWAAGVVCYGLLAGYFPFRNTQPRKLHREILSNSPAKLEWQSNVSRAARDFVSQMLDPLVPVTATEMLRHPFLAGKDIPEAAVEHNVVVGVTEEIRYATTPRKSRSSAWSCDSTDVSEKMVSLDDWPRAENVCRRYAMKMLEMRRREVQSDARRQQNCGSARFRPFSPSTLERASTVSPEPNQKRLSKISFGKMPGYPRGFFRLPRPFSMAVVPSDRSDTTHSDAETRAGDFPDSLSDVETLAHDTVHSTGNAPGLVTHLFGGNRVATGSTTGSGDSQRGSGSFESPSPPIVKAEGKLGRAVTLLRRWSRAVKKTT